MNKGTFNKYSPLCITQKDWLGIRRMQQKIKEYG